MSNKCGKRKAGRILNLIQIYQKKIDRIQKDSPVDRLQKEIEHLKSFRVLIHCPQCNRDHSVSLNNYQKGRWRHICRNCFDNNRKKELSKITDAFVKAHPEFKVEIKSIDTHSPRHSVHFYIHTEEYLKDVKPSDE